MLRPWLMIWTAALLATVSAFASDPVTLVGIDEEGNPVEVVLEKEEYASRFKAVSSAVAGSTLTALGRNDLQGVSGKPWQLKTVVVGVGVGMEAGVGPVLKVKAVPRFRLAFSSALEPVLP